MTFQDSRVRGCSKGISVVQPFPFSMSKAGFDESICEECRQPLFLSLEECKEFIEKKLQEGFIVCGCCGTEEKVEHKAN